MNRVITVAILGLAFIGGFLFFYNPKPASAPVQEDSSIKPTLQEWEPVTDEQANVTVTITPSDLMWQSKEWKFDVVVNTHSVELDQDMASIATLADDNGKEYQALRWEGAAVGGHHGEGVLVFDAVTPYPQHLKLIIRGIANVERSFTWTLTE